MTEQPAMTGSVEHAPTCYRHPQRETWVSCGRCGKPLCPDCIEHGPVGVRCRECLLPQGRNTGLVAPQRVGMSITVACIQAIVWIGVITWVTWIVGISTVQDFSQRHPIGMYGIPADICWSPNILLSCIAGLSIGWTMWRICGRVWNTLIIRVAVLLGIAIPFVAAGLIAIYLISLGAGDYFSTPLIYVRTLFAVGLCTLMSYLTVTNNA